MNKRVLIRVCSVVFALLLAGCQVFTDPTKLVGQTESQALTYLGGPSASYQNADGSRRLQYSGQPWGTTVWNVDIDPQGVVTQAYQQLSSDRLFLTPVDGSWGKQEVLYEFGSPAFVDSVMSWDGEIWNYRWWEVHDMFFHIYFDQDGRVKKAHQSIDMTKNLNDWR